MKVFILLAAVAVCHGAKLDKTYLPPHAHSSGGAADILQAPGQGAAPGQNPFGPNAYAQSANFAPAYGNRQSAYERPRASVERNAAILRQSNSNDGERYSYAYETENGIYAEENGVATDGVQAQGGFTYTGDDGKQYSIRYTADENGFVPQGEHLPTPHPVPEEILRALEQNARDEAAGIYDDGSYSAAKYGDAGSAYPAGAGFSAGQLSGSADSVAVNAATKVSTAAYTRATFGPQQAYLPPRQSYSASTGYRY